VTDILLHGDAAGDADGVPVNFVVVIELVDTVETVSGPVLSVADFFSHIEPFLLNITQATTQHVCTPIKNS